MFFYKRISTFKLCLFTGILIVLIPAVLPMDINNNTNRSVITKVKNTTSISYTTTTIVPPMTMTVSYFFSGPRAGDYEGFIKTEKREEKLTYRDGNFIIELFQAGRDSYRRQKRERNS